MKRFLLLLLTFMLPTVVLAVNVQVWQSSNTASADTTKVLCTKNRGYVHGVCVNTGTAGTYTVYASSGQAASPVAAISTASVGCLYYDVAVSSGVTYSNSATANVTLMYACY